MSTVYHENTPLTDNGHFMVFVGIMHSFDFPLCHQEEFELNFIEGAQGAIQIVGNNLEEVLNAELVPADSNVPPGCFSYDRKEVELYEITIQLQHRNQLNFICTILVRSADGFSFSPGTLDFIKPSWIALNQSCSFGSVPKLMSILHDPSIAHHIHTLNENFTYDSRFEKAFEFMKANYEKNISFKDMADIVNMTVVGFSRFIKKRNDILLEQASCLLIDTILTIAEVWYRCGFKNLWYFNPIFKKNYNCTPKEFRINYSGTRTFI